jgi:hypothetical protein
MPEQSGKAEDRKNPKPKRLISWPFPRVKERSLRAAGS